MLVNSKRLSHTPVRTRSGANIGKVASLDLDAETGRLVTLHARVSGMVSGLLEHEVLVAWSQVVSLSETEVIVEDAAALPTTSRFARQFSPTPAPRASGLHGKTSC